MSSSDASLSNDTVLPECASTPTQTPAAHQHTLPPIENERVCRILVRFALKTEEMHLEKTTTPTVPTETA